MGLPVVHRFLLAIRGSRMMVSRLVVSRLGTDVNPPLARYHLACRHRHCRWETAAERPSVNGQGRKPWLLHTSR